MTKLTEQIRKKQWYKDNCKEHLARSKKWVKDNKARARLNRQRYYWNIERVTRLERNIEAIENEI